MDYTYLDKLKIRFKMWLVGKTVKLWFPISKATSLEYTMIWRDKECLHLVLMKDPFERIAKGTEGYRI